MSTAAEKTRPSFIIDGKPYVSAGVILYTEDPRGRLHLLLQKLVDKDYIWADFGGKSEPEDTSIEEVAFRECQQELNYAGGVTADFLRTQLADHRSTMYKIPDLKYMLYVIYVPYSFKVETNPLVFGTREVHDDIERTVSWISYYDFYKTNNLAIHPRLKAEEFKVNLPLIIAKGMSKGENLFY